MLFLKYFFCNYSAGESTNQSREREHEFGWSERQVTASVREGTARVTKGMFVLN